ncbi:hypothetical protein EJ08DRAFT_655145 [Tothia fuscella]|uniref:Uncharacterized protein n=1 Tax=Tothia fuscella TaxID=1048955 RepID=A0A9P4P3Y7_9PEZI|nr:hypothetical protein EJ08DRAFT_655145 [Tothia fuscella]
MSTLSIETNIETPDVPKLTRIQLSQNTTFASSPTKRIGWFPTTPLLRYSHLARTQLLQKTCINTIRGEHIASITLPHDGVDKEWLRYILHFLRTVPKTCAEPQIRYPGLFCFSEAVKLYRTTLAMDLPWDQWLLREQLVEYSQHNPLRANEFILVWGSFRSSHVLVQEMLKKYISVLKSKSYDQEQIVEIKRFCRQTPEILKALDAAGNAMNGRRGIGGIDSVMAKAKRERTRRDLIVKGLLPLDQTFLGWLRGGGKLRY